MPVGTCNPATRGDPYNVMQLAVGNGDVFVVIRYGWDGISTKDTPGGCEGPLVNGTGSGNVWAISYVNAGQTTYYMHTIGRNGQARTFQINPGANGTITANQAASQGYVNRSDCDNLSLTTVP